MAEEAFKDDLEKSEEPTSKRREEARKKGQFPKSREMIPVATLIAIAVTLKFGGGELMERLARCVAGFFTAAGNTSQVGSEDLMRLSFETGLLFAPVMLPMFAGILFFGLGTGFLQTGFVLASEPVRFDISRVSPIKGFKRLFSLTAVADSMKAILFILGVGCVGGVFIYNELPALISLTTLAAGDMVGYATQDASALSAWILATMAILTGLDFLFQRWHTEKQLRMSRHEVKEEMREQEGDPLLKSHLKSMRQRMSRRRMMSEVAKADVVITNPTHLAVALRYRAEEMGAPRVLGKGAGFIAEKIREVARSRGIPIVENKPLARMLYQQAEIDREIPETLFRAVAGVLAYVYRLRAGDRAKTEKAPADPNRQGEHRRNN